MRQKNVCDRTNEWTILIDEDGSISGDIEAIRLIYHQKEQMGLSFDDIPYCG